MQPQVGDAACSLGKDGLRIKSDDAAAAAELAQTIFNSDLNTQKFMACIRPWQLGLWILTWVHGRDFRSLGLSEVQIPQAQDSAGVTS